MARHGTILDLSAKKRLRVAGLMSGTSADGVDVAIVDIDNRSTRLAAFAMYPYSATIRKAIFSLFDPATSTVDEICHYNFVLGDIFADAVIKLCDSSGISLKTIDLIGSHGQTIYHNPSSGRYAKRLVRSTLQIGEPAVIAQRTGITTVADFRPADMAVGGQGAPLVPFADYILFADKRITRAVQNIGGIANVTYLPASSSPDKIIAFDTGPGNMIIDGLINLISGGKKRYDRNGAFAAKGTVSRVMLSKMLNHPYFNRRPPKTTGREEFGLRYSRDIYKYAVTHHVCNEDIVATATDFTAVTIADAYRRFLPKMPEQVILCGGGAKNKTLIKMLRERLDKTEILTTGDFGIDPDAKEAVSFAILAWAAVKGVPGSVPAATGGQRPVILGKIVQV
ncbi:MAG: anhydro-N-acetylmuramic acid kinase [Planctomycetes bacterium]|nr:anhydro-N-acetylmuramic acid kinase [Planctomycetota bacterium]